MSEWQLAMGQGLRTSLKNIVPRCRSHLCDLVIWFCVLGLLVPRNYSNKWCQSQRFKYLEYLWGHMVTGEPVNVSGKSHGLFVAGELDSGPGKRLPGDHMGYM